MTRFTTTLIALSFLSVFSSQKSAFAVSALCDCSGTPEVKENVACPRAPVRLKEKLNCFTEAGAVSCASAHPLDFVSAMESITHTSSHKPADGSKSLDEILDYVSCYRSDGEKGKMGFCNFKNNVAPDIVLAAELSGRSLSVAACSYFLESQFNPKAESGMHAKGYPQFLDGAVESMNAVIQGPLEKWKANLADEMTEFQSLSKELNLTKRSDKNKRFSLTLKMNHLKARITENRMNISAREIWENGWKGTPNAPHALSMPDKKHPKKYDSRGCRHEAFLMGEMYYQYGIYESGIFDLKEKNGELVAKGFNNLEISIMEGAAYDNGSTGFASHCRGVKSLRQCIERYAAGSEPRKYMESIRRCAMKNHKDSWDPMNSGDPKRSCGAYQCSK